MNDPTEQTAGPDRHFLEATSLITAERKVGQVRFNTAYGRMPDGFNLEGLKVGDTFLGCMDCFWRLAPGEACKPICPECGRRLFWLSVKPGDLPDQPGERHE